MVFGGRLFQIFPSSGGGGEPLYEGDDYWRDDYHSGEYGNCEIKTIN